jgi:hypothetical protein
MQYLRHSLAWQAVASLIVAFIWLTGSQLVAINSGLAFLFFAVVGLVSLTMVTATAALTGTKHVGAGICFAIVAVIAGITRQPNIVLVAAGAFVAWGRATFIYEKTSGWTPLTLALFVSFPAGALYVLLEPGAYGWLADHGFRGLAERPIAPALPSLAFFALQALLVASRGRESAA